MSPEVQDFVQTHLHFPGLAGWGARLADRTVVRRSFEPWLPAAQVEQALNRLALAAEGLQQQRIEHLRSCWVFEKLRIHLALGQDGACLALFIENRPDLPQAEVARALEAFSTLPQ
jgi:hypothetical protein